MADQSTLRARALAAGLSRAPAWVGGIIAFWSQAKGGVAIDGIVWRFRSHAEIATELGYGEKTVGRAVADLRKLGLLHVRRIWHPMKPGQSVNAYALTKAGLQLFQPKEATKGVQFPQGGACEADILVPSKLSQFDDQSTHPAPVINSANNSEIEASQATALSHVGESVGEDYDVSLFAEYEKSKSWSQVDENVRHVLFRAFKRLVKARFGASVGNYGPKQAEWMSQYLGPFEEAGLEPVYAGAALLRAVWDWDEFRLYLAKAQGKPAKPFPRPYDLGIYGHEFMNWLQMEKDQLMTSNPF